MKLKTVCKITSCTGNWGRDALYCDLKGLNHIFTNASKPNIFIPVVLAVTHT